MAVICPTVTAFDPHEYRAQMERLEPFAKRIHIDLMDGEFAPTKSPDLNTIWWPPELVADIHLMYQRPAEYLEQLIALKPNLVVIHFEAEVRHAEFAAKLHKHDIKAGLAVLADTSVEIASQAMASFDHVLVFSGNLGHHGGQADLSLLSKAREIREQYPEAEIAWDGGINDQNAKQLIGGGIDVLNTGGFIQNAEDPLQMFELLQAKIEVQD